MPKLVGLRPQVFSFSHPNQRVAEDRIAPFSFDLWAKKYLDYMELERRASSHTLRAYGLDVMDFLSYRNQLDDYKIKMPSCFQDTRKLIRGFQVYLYDRKLSIRSTLRKLACINSFFQYLSLHDVINVNPFDYIDLPKMPKSLPRFLTEEQVFKLLSSVRRIKYRYKIRDVAFIELLYSTGIRVDEACRLNIEDIDFDQGLIKVTGKGSKERIIPIGAPAIKAIRNYLGHQGKYFKSNHAETGPLWSNRRNGGIGTRGAFKILQTVRRLTSFEVLLHPHIFRHSFASHLLDRGCDIRVLQEMLGHVSLGSTEIYTHVSIKKIRLEYFKAHPRA